jgi:glycine oxidase
VPDIEQYRALPDNRPAIRYSPAARRMEVNGLYRHGFLLSPAVVEEVLVVLPQLLKDPYAELGASSTGPGWARARRLSHATDSQWTHDTDARSADA